MEPISSYIQMYNEKTVQELIRETLEQTIIRFTNVVDAQESIKFIPMAFIDSNCISLMRYCTEVSHTYKEIGEKVANCNRPDSQYKYGENRSKLLEQLGVVEFTEDAVTRVKTTEFGKLLLSKYAGGLLQNILIKLTVSIPVINKILRTPPSDPINLAQYFGDSFSLETISRRSSSLKHILRDIEVVYGQFKFVKRIAICPNEEPTKTSSSDVVPSEDDNPSEDFDEGRDFVILTKRDEPSLPQEEPSDVEPESIQIPIDNSVVEVICEPPGTAYSKPEEKCEEVRELSPHLKPILKIKSHIAECYAIDTEFSLKGILDTLGCIIEDPDTDFIIQNFAEIALGYFVKNAVPTKDSLEKCEYVAIAALQCIYELNMNLLIYNLSPLFDLPTFYSAKEKLNGYLSPGITQALSESGIFEYYEEYAESNYTPEYLQEIEQMYTSEAHLFLRLNKYNSNDLGDDQPLLLHYISQSRINYPQDGQDSSLLPLKTSKFYGHTEKSISSLIAESIDWNHLDMMTFIQCLSVVPDSWKYKVKELCVLSYLIHPFRIPQAYDEDFGFMLLLSQLEKMQDTDENNTIKMEQEIDEYSGHFNELIQSDIMNRILYDAQQTMFDSIISITALEFVRSEVQDLTYLCSKLDKNNGFRPKYKSRVGMGCELSVAEKMETDNYCGMRRFSCSPESRKLRIINRSNYDE